MSASGATTNYNLSQFISTDIPSWLGDYNGDMLKIDTGINGAKLAADSAALAASAAQNDASTALSNVGTLSTTVGTLSNTVGTAVGNINTINSLIGNGTPTTTDQTIIGAINELHADQGDLADLTTTDKTSLVAAINEVAGGGGTTQKVVDFTDVIVSETTVTAGTEGTYTVTQPCLIQFYIAANGSGGGYAKVNDVSIASGYLSGASGANAEINEVTPILCTGDVFKIKSFNVDGKYTVYGLRDLS